MLRLLLVLLLAAPAVFAQPDPPAPRVVMNLAAHPDDEDGATMAHYRFAHDAVVHSVLFNRGEGGQNEIGPQLYAELGAIRTGETEAAARHLGVQVHFLNFDDFGFSKRADETFERWGGEEEVVARLVHVIRRVKPDVMFTNHDTVTVGPRRQHGHHQAVALAAMEAMRLAADPSFRPEQLAEEGVDLWQPHRFFQRVWRGAPAELAAVADVRVPVSDVPEGQTRSAADRAVAAAAEHRSQGFDLIAERFRRDTTYFVLLDAAPNAPPLRTGETDITADLPPNPHAATASVVHRIDAGRVPPLDVTAASVVVPGGAVPFRVRDVPEDANLVVLGVPAEAVAWGRTEGDQRSGVIRLPGDARPTLPKARAQYERTVNHPPFQVAALDARGNLLAAAHLPTEIAPPFALDLAEAVAMPGGLAPRVLLRPGENTLTVIGRAWADGLGELPATLRFAPSRELAVGMEQRVTLAVRDGRIEETVTLTLPDRLAPGAYAVSLDAEAADHAERLTYEGRILPAVALPDGLRVGFVRSYDASTEAALREMGADVTPLDSTALATSDFDGLHTIVVDIRAYLDRADLRAHNDRLLDWVQRGGHLVVTYHKTMEWNPDGGQNPDAAEWAPYPLRLGRDRVTQHDAPVTHLVPDHPLFQTPNRITADDWDGWIQERGLYFPSEYEDAYTELLAMSDPGEEPLHSSTLIAEVGNGTYLFTALGWYRQLGAFVPGAYRAFANLISLPLAEAE